MRKVLPAGPVFQAGTLSGNPLAMAAGIATLQELRDRPPYARLEQLGAKLAEGLSAAARAAGVPHCLNRVGSMGTLFFAAGPAMDYDSAHGGPGLLRPLLLGDDEPRLLPAVQPFRGRLPVSGPHG
jgi:glutamate-1-semialdehyde 2,1-aminomutase